MEDNEIRLNSKNLSEYCSKNESNLIMGNIPKVTDKTTLTEKNKLICIIGVRAICDNRDKKCYERVPNAWSTLCKKEK